MVCGSKETSVTIPEKADDAAWLAKGSLFTLNGSLAGRGLQIATQVALARLLGPATFGLYAIGWTLLRIGTTLTPLGLDNGAIHCAMRHFGTDQKRMGKILGTSLSLTFVFSALAAVGMCLTAPALADWVFHKHALLPVIYAFAAGLPLAAGLRVASASTTVSQSMKYRVYAELLAQPAVNLVLVGALYLIGWRLLGAVAAAVLSFGFALALAFAFERHVFSHIFINVKSSANADISDLMRFSVTSWFGIVFLAVIPWVDRLFVGAYLSPAEVGIYQAAAQAAVLLVVIAGAFNVVVAPRISYFFQHGEMDRLVETFRVATKWVLYANIPIFLVFAFGPGLLLRVIYGANYVAGAGPLVVLSAAWLLDTLAGPLGTLLVFTSHQRVFSWISACGLFLAIVLNYLLIPHFGPIGAAIGVGAAETAMMTTLLVSVRVALGFWPQDFRWLKGVAAALAAAVVLWILRPMDFNPAIVGLLLTVALASATFVAGLFVLGFDQEDRELFRAVKGQLVALAQGA
jgi:O-antigen/teichoic acid export membrane protein